MPLQVIQSIAGIAVVMKLNARLACLVLGGVAVRSIFAHYYSRFSRRISQAQQDALATSSGVAEQGLSLIKVIALDEAPDDLRLLQASNISVSTLECP